MLTKPGAVPRDVNSAKPLALTIWAAPHHIGARTLRFCKPAKTNSAPRSAATNTVTTEKVWQIEMHAATTTRLTAAS